MGYKTSNDLTGPQERDYDAAVAKVRERFGSYDNIGNRFFAETGRNTSGVVVRRWFLFRNLPVFWACILHDLMDGEVTLFDFYPYLAKYMNHTCKNSPPVGEPLVAKDYLA